MTTVTGQVWLLLLPAVPAAPSRHRVAVWRELRRAGAVSVASGAWTVPDLPTFTSELPAIREVVERNGGTLTVLRALEYDEGAVDLLVETFAAARRAELAAFIEDCVEADAVLDGWIAAQRLSFRELDAHERRLGQLRRRHRALLQRNTLNLDAVYDATRGLDRSAAACARYAELVATANLPTA